MHPLDGAGALGGETGIGGTSGNAGGGSGGGTVSGGSGGITSGGTGGGTTAGPITAIWYSPEYANKGHYIWSPSYVAASPFSGVCDFDGDGKADGLLRLQTNWSVMISDGTSFPAVWGLSAFGSDTDRPVIGDVNGDKRCDAVLFTPNSGTWVGSHSAGTNLQGAYVYITNFGTNADNQFVADVNGDGRADAVAFFTATGRWNVALSDTTTDRFVDSGTWRDGAGAGSTAQLMGDVNGDGRADAVVFTQSTGEWRVALSTGSSFGTANVWITSFGSAATRVLLGDVTGDGLDDAVSFKSSTGTWDAAPAKSTADGFGTPQRLADEQGIGATAELVGDVQGSKRDALVGIWPDGSWRILPSNVKRPAAWNTWEARDVRYAPLDGSAKPVQYDGESGSVIAQHLASLTAAKIDVALLDLTRYPVTDDEYTKTNALAVCSAIGNALRNGAAAPLFAIAVASTAGSPQSIEDAAAQVDTDFLRSGRCGSGQAYFNLDGKPLLVIAAEYADRTAWEAWNGDKTASAKFTLRWAQKSMPGAVPVTSYGEYYGFAYSSGPLDDQETMVVVPGFSQRVGPFTTRNPSGVAAGTYEQAWTSALTRKPRVLVIESFNDYVRETAVAPTDTSKVVSPTEAWVNSSSSPAPTLYWDLTVTHNAERKN